MANTIQINGRFLNPDGSAPKDDYIQVRITDFAAFSDSDQMGRYYYEFAIDDFDGSFVVELPYPDDPNQAFNVEFQLPDDTDFRALVSATSPTDWETFLGTIQYKQPYSPLSDYVSKRGDTMTGALTLPGDPTTGLQAATKSYVDAGDGGGNPMQLLPTAVEDNLASFDAAGQVKDSLSTATDFETPAGSQNKVDTHNALQTVHGVDLATMETTTGAQAKADAAQAAAEAASVPLTDKGSQNGVAELDASGIVPQSQLPQGNTTTVTDTIAEMLLLTGVLSGDRNIVLDDPSPANNGEWIALQDDPTLISHWEQIPSGDGVISWAGKSGIVEPFASDVKDSSNVTTVQDHIDATTAHGQDLTTMESVTGSQQKVDTHAALTTDTHGVTSPDALESTVGAQDKANTAETNAKVYTDTHEAKTTGIHGFADTTDVMLKSIYDPPDVGIVDGAIGLNLSLTNNSGITLNVGDLVRIDYDNLVIEGLARQDTQFWCDAFVLETIANGATGRVEWVGWLLNMDTTLLKRGDPVYLAATGGITHLPTAPDYQIVGHTMVTHATNGIVKFYPSGATSRISEPAEGSVSFSNELNLNHNLAVTTDTWVEVHIPIVSLNLVNAVNVKLGDTPGQLQVDYTGSEHPIPDTLNMSLSIAISGVTNGANRQIDIGLGRNGAIITEGLVQIATGGQQTVDIGLAGAVTVGVTDVVNLDAFSIFVRSNYTGVFSVTGMAMYISTVRTNQAGIL